MNTLTPETEYQLQPDTPESWREYMSSLRKTICEEVTKAREALNIDHQSSHAHSGEFNTTKYFKPRRVVGVEVFANGTCRKAGANCGCADEEDN